MNKDQFLQTLKEQYYEQGVILTTKTSKPGRVVLKCDRGGTYAPAKPSSTRRSEIYRESMIVNNRHRLDVFQNLIYKVSQYALNKLYEQFLMIDLSMQPTVCTGKFRKTFGIPCKHEIRDSIECGTPLALSDVHIQWHLQLILNEDTVENHQQDSPRKRLLAEMEEKLYRSDIVAGSLMARLQDAVTTPFVQIMHPNAVTKKRGRPAGAKNKTNLTRDKSHFEYMEGRKCGQCGMPGHNSRTCANKMN